MNTVVKHVPSLPEDRNPLVFQHCQTKVITGTFYNNWNIPFHNSSRELSDYFIS